MARTRILVNDDTSDWVVSQFGGLVVPQSDTLDIGDIVSDAEIDEAINDNGLVLSALHKLRVNNLSGSTTDLVDSADWELALMSQLDMIEPWMQNVFFGDKSKDYAEGKVVTYIAVKTFRFPGTDNLAKNPNKAEFLIYLVGTPTSGQARIYDSTNVNTIAEVSTTSSDADNFEIDDSLTNLPTGEATFEVQMKGVGVGGGKKVYMRTLRLFYEEP